MPAPAQCVHRVGARVLRAIEATGIQGTGVPLCEHMQVLWLCLPPFFDQVRML